MDAGLGKQAVKSLMLHLINENVRKPPYITIVSKKQIWFGNGRFKHSEYPKGLLGALNLKIPSKSAREQKEQFYGYKALIGPWTVLNQITNDTIRRQVLYEIINDGEFSDIRPILGKGYIRQDGTLDPKQTQGISCYVFFMADHDYRDEQNEWVSYQPDFVKAQIFRNMQTHKKLLQKKQKAASTLVANNKKLLSFGEYLEIEHGVDRSQITWEDDE